MKQRIILYADKGKMLTDGTIYGTQILLADGVNPSAFHEITEAEAKEIFEKEESGNGEENLS